MCLPYFHMASPLLLVDHGAAATAVPKKACRAAAAYAAFASTATTAAAAASAAAAAAATAAAPVFRDASRSFLFSIRDLHFLVI